MSVNIKSINGHLLEDVEARAQLLQVGENIQQAFDGLGLSVIDGKLCVRVERTECIEEELT